VRLQLEELPDRIAPSVAIDVLGLATVDVHLDLQASVSTPVPSVDLNLNRKRDELRSRSRATSSGRGSSRLRRRDGVQDPAARRHRRDQPAEDSVRLEDAQARVNDEIIPEKQLLSEATGTLQFASIPLLPSVQFTVPLLLLAGSMWLAWRVVNMPAFADFLIATEAEMNKVSWTTQKRLVQDTIVVLVTVLLMAVFLLTADYLWKTVLSWKPIGVLHIPSDTRGEKQKMEEKKW
jgi:preprotein translocase SecE subunit